MNQPAIDKAIVDAVDHFHQQNPSQLAEGSALRIDGLNVSIRGNPILTDVSFDVPQRSITCIIGPSGCGKTTLLRSLNRLHDHTAGITVTGRVTIDGKDIYAPGVDVASLRRRMGLLAQRPTVLPMSVFENVAYGPRLYGVNQKVLIHAIVERNLKAVGLWNEVHERLHSPAGHLSVGQQQRLCLARALAVQPAIILGDEATSALDPLSTLTIEELLVRLKQQLSIILVTHTLRQARRIADYVVFMYMGRMVEAGPANQIFNQPAHELTKKFVAGSIG